MAQLSLGNMYLAGRGVPQDDDEAERWYRRAAEQGLAAAQYELGLWSQHRRQDHVEAIKWYRRAAEQGNRSAQNDLGLIYHLGWVVPHDYGEALKWYRRAAERGQASAQHNLGTMYAEGLGVLQDYVQAYMWFSIYEAAGAGKAAVGRLARKLMPTVPNWAADDCCGAPANTASFQVISKSRNPAPVTTASNSASSRAPATQPFHRSMSRLASSETGFCTMMSPIWILPPGLSIR